jgi:hypothetical protein
MRVDAVAGNTCLTRPWGGGFACRRSRRAAAAGGVGYGSYLQLRPSITDSPTSVWSFHPSETQCWGVTQDDDTQYGESPNMMTLITGESPNMSTLNMGEALQQGEVCSTPGLTCSLGKT